MFTLNKNGSREHFTFDVRYYRSIAIAVGKESKNTPSSGMYMFIANMSDNNGMSYRYTDVKDFTVFRGRSV